MGEILDLKTIHDYNKFLGLETLNPLVGFVDFSKVEVLPHRCKCFGFYAIFLKEIRLSGRHIGVHCPRTGGRHQRWRRDAAPARLCPVVPSRPYPGYVAGTEDEGLYFLFLRSERSPAHVGTRTADRLQLLQ